MDTTIHGIGITNSALFGMWARHILRGKTRGVPREVYMGD